MNPTTRHEVVIDKALSYTGQHYLGSYICPGLTMGAQTCITTTLAHTLTPLIRMLVLSKAEVWKTFVLFTFLQFVTSYPIVLSPPKGATSLM